MTQHSDLAEANPAEGIVVFSRVFDAPRDLVFKAWTEADRLAQWWGPKGFTVKVARLDLRPGGIFHYVLDGPNDVQMWGRFVYREIDAPRRLVFVTSFSDPEGGITRHPMAPTWPLEVVSTLTFTDQNGKTLIVGQAMPVNASPEENKTFEENETSVKAGMKGTLDQLDAYLAEAA